MGAFDYLRQNKMEWHLAPTEKVDFLFFKEMPCDLYTILNNEMRIFFKKGTALGPLVLEKVFSAGLPFFIKEEDHQDIQRQQKEILRKLTRSLSMGNKADNIKNQMAAVALNLHYLYDDPTNEEKLQFVTQGIGNLCRFLLDNPELIKVAFEQTQLLPFHFTIRQPLLASLLFLGLIRTSVQFSNKEVENLFLVSVLKDIGMGLIPKELHNKQELDQHERKIYGGHAHNSKLILNGRMTIPPYFFDIIANHHAFGSDQSTTHNELHAPADGKDGPMLVGVETMLMSSLDGLLAMISKRPYRDGMTLLQSLEVLKQRMGNEYTQEFRFMVNYLYRFFQN